MTPATAALAKWHLNLVVIRGYHFDEDDDEDYHVDDDSDYPSTK